MKADEKSRFVCTSCGKQWPTDYCQECAQAINCRIDTNRHVSQAKPTEPAIAAPNVPSHVTDSGSIKLAENYVISPNDHSVDDPNRAKQKYHREGLENLVLWLVIGVAFSGIALLLKYLSKPESIPDFLWNFDFFRLCYRGWYYIILFAIVMSPVIGLGAGIRSLYKSCIVPKLSTPEKSIECFLRSTDVGLYKRAYNLLTDQAQKLGKLDLNESDDIFAKKIPKEVEISDLSSFEAWWRGVNICWPPKWKKLVRHDISSDVCVLEFPVQLSYPKACGSLMGELISFNAVFPLVQRERMWFVAKPFIWPFGGFQLVKKYAKIAETITSKNKSSQEEIGQTDYTCELKDGQNELDELEKANIIGRRNLLENCGAVYRVLSKSKRGIKKTDKVHAMGTLTCSVCAKNFKVDFEVAFKGYFDFGSKNYTKCTHCQSSIEITGESTEIEKGKPKFWLIVLRETVPVNAPKGEFRLVLDSLSAIEERTTPPQVTRTDSTQMAIQDHGSRERNNARHEENHKFNFVYNTWAAWRSGVLSQLMPLTKACASVQFAEFTKCAEITHPAVKMFMNKYSPLPFEFLVGYDGQRKDRPYFILTNERLIIRRKHDRQYTAIRLSGIAEFHGAGRSRKFSLSLVKHDGRTFDFKHLADAPRDDVLEFVLKKANSRDKSQL